MQLSAWCAWDTLFLSALLGRPANVESRSPLDGDPISLRVARERIGSAVLANLLVSMVRAHESDDFIRTFCHQIHFFASAGEGRRWTAGHEGTFPMPLADAFELATRANRARYGSVVPSRR